MEICPIKWWHKAWSSLLYIISFNLRNWEQEFSHFEFGAFFKTQVWPELIISFAPKYYVKQESSHYRERKEEVSLAQWDGEEKKEIFCFQGTRKLLQPEIPMRLDIEIVQFIP